jgi:hypothetical protein
LECSTIFCHCETAQNTGWLIGTQVLVCKIKPPAHAHAHASFISTTTIP